VRVYFDSSALLKRALDEAESDAFEVEVERFVDRGFELISSALAWVEVTRSLRSRLDTEPPKTVAALIEESLVGIVESPISPEVIDIARRLGPSTLRSLGAIHLATATLVGADLVCAYDTRLLTSASELGFRTISPGAD
jgi:predicted nucleic acid-binding protein